MNWGSHLDMGGNIFKDKNLTWVQLTRVNCLEIPLTWTNENLQMKVWLTVGTESKSLLSFSCCPVLIMWLNSCTLVMETMAKTSWCLEMLYCLFWTFEMVTGTGSYNTGLGSCHDFVERHNTVCVWSVRYQVSITAASGGKQEALMNNGWWRWVLFPHLTIERTLSFDSKISLLFLPQKCALWNSLRFMSPPIIKRPPKN